MDGVELGDEEVEICSSVLDDGSNQNDQIVEPKVVAPNEDIMEDNPPTEESESESEPELDPEIDWSMKKVVFKETQEYLSVERTVSRRPFRALLDIGILIGGCFEEIELIGDIHRKTNLVGMLLHT
ncbi:hypothetical protein C5167_029312 [Papaver somniferum]|nr:hypothetical protein C5167_029312 [Papaver somniferum]